MGKKKNNKVSLNEKFQPFAKANCSVPARNLVKSNLGAVVFGCKNHTIKECYAKELFGLPASHFAYVKNITPGLVLFLFNYSDRTLHGIFEATSPGQMNINPHGWTDDGTRFSPYPAQVKVCIQRRCYPLTEDQFRPIISSNYYEHNFFWFELDRSQTSKLVSSFTSLPCAGASTSKNTTNLNTFYNPLPAFNTRQQVESKDDTRLTSTYNQQKTWSSLFKTSSDCDSLGKDEVFWTEALNSCPPLDESNMEVESSSALPCSKRESSESEGDAVDSSHCSEEIDNWETNWESPPPLTLSVSDTQVLVLDSSNVSDTQVVVLDSSDVSDTQVVVLDSSDVSDTQVVALDSSQCNHEIDASHFSDIQSVVVKLIQEIEGLKGSQLKQIIKINHLEKELVDSKKQIAQLENRCNMLESGEFSSVVRVGEDHESLDELTPDMDETILIVGGFDGSSWLADLDSYNPSCDVMTSLCPMTTRRSYASAAKLGGELFVFGGVDGDVWYDTVESYNLRSERWVSRPSLNMKKGSLAGVYLNEKIFAIGGGKGVNCFAEVEMYDPYIGRWIFTKSMQYKRFAPAASEMNNALYVTGGYDGTNYLSTVERFDPREHSWVGIGNMSTKRGGHSVVVLDEKLYALGGCDADRMHSTVEIFDPRMNSWTIGESMNNSRGYSGAVVVGGKIYVIGGIKEKGEILDTIECYKEGYGWEVTNLDALGKRCFFSAIVF